MTLKDYNEYVRMASVTANARWGPRLKYFIIGFVLIGGLGALAYSKAVEYPVIGALGGAFVGYAIFQATVAMSTMSTAEDLYRVDWCEARGMKYIGDDYFPPDAPYATSGDKRKATDAYEGEWNGLSTLFYNFTYTDEGDSDDADTNYHFKIMRLQGRELPIHQLSFKKRGALNRFEWADKLQGAMTSERPVSLESVAFNESYDLTIDDRADDIWIRRIFDPATIQAVVEGSAVIPDLRYAFGSWWFVEKYHFETSELELWVEKQRIAAAAVQLLSRVQSL